MINSYGTKVAYSKKTELSNLNISSFENQTVHENIIEDWKLFSEKSFAFKNLLAKRLVAGQSIEDFSKLITQMQKVHVNSGDVIYQPESKQEFIYFPETAIFSQMNILEDGRTVETAMIGSEGIVGLSSILDFRPTNFWTQALIAGSAFKIRAEVFKQEFVRVGFLQTAFFEYINSFIRQISQRAICNNHHRIEERFSTWLLMLEDRIGKDGKNRLALTQEQIAQLLGVHRPSVTCIAQELRDNGVINYLRGRIFILNRQKLEAAACECYAAIN